MSAALDTCQIDGRVQNVKQTHALRDLIDDTAARNGWTLADIATRAQRAGHDLSPQNISRIKKGPTVNLVAKQVRALAAGLGIAVDVVINANLRAVGFAVDCGGELDARRAIEKDPSLTERDRHLLLAVLEAASESARSGSGSRVEETDVNEEPLGTVAFLITPGPENWRAPHWADRGELYAALRARIAESWPGMGEEALNNMATGYTERAISDAEFAGLSLPERVDRLLVEVENFLSPAIADDLTRRRTPEPTEERWAAHKGTPSGGRDLTSGEGSQERGSDDPA